LEDDTALQMILNIQPKTYNYIDMRSKRSGQSGWSERDAQQATSYPPVYGFIAQQIRQVIPDAVRIQTEFIPNIFTVAEYNDNIIRLPSSLNAYMLYVASKVKCYDMRDNTIIVEVIEVINQSTFRIKDIKYGDTKIFVYGTEVKDFHAVNKEYINTLNVCAVQELHRKIIAQQSEIKELKDKVKGILEYIEMNK
jgi:hypothetical protein